MGNCFVTRRWGPFSVLPIPDSKVSVVLPSLTVETCHLPLLPHAHTQPAVYSTPCPHTSSTPFKEFPSSPSLILLPIFTHVFILPLLFPLECLSPNNYVCMFLGHTFISVAFLKKFFYTKMMPYFG